MIEKALPSGLWARSVGCWCPFIISHISSSFHCPFHPSFHHSRCDTAKPIGAVHKKWGIPGFHMVLLLLRSPSGMALWFWCSPLFLLPYHVEIIQCHHSCINLPMNWQLWKFEPLWVQLGIGATWLSLSLQWWWADLRYRPVSLSGSTWSLILLWIQFEALFCFMTVDECFQKHSLYSWVGMLWFHRSRKFFDLLEDYESNWDDFGSSVPILVIDSYIWDVGEAYLIASCEYVRYFGIVRTMPTYSIWHLGIWSGSLLRDLCLCDLLLTFGYCTTLALWLLMTGY